MAKMSTDLFTLYDIAKHLNGYPFVVSHASGVNFTVTENKGMSILLCDTESGQPIGWAQPGSYPNPSERSWRLVQDLRSGEPVDMQAKDEWTEGKAVKRARGGILSDFDQGGKVTRLSTDMPEVMDAVGVIPQEGGWSDGDVVQDQNSPFEIAGTQGAEVDRGAGSEEFDDTEGVM